MSQSTRALFHSFVFEYMCVHSFNLLLAPKPKLLLYLCRTSRFSFFVCTVCFHNWSCPSLFLYCCAHNIRFFSPCLSSFFFLSIHSVTSSKTMPYPAVHYVECTTSADKRVCLLCFSFSVMRIHQLCFINI